MTDTSYILQEQYFGKYYWPLNYWPLVYAVTPFGYAEIWDGVVIMNLAVAGNVMMNLAVNAGVVMNKEINQPNYEELQEL